VRVRRAAPRHDRDGGGAHRLRPRASPALRGAADGGLRPCPPPPPARSRSSSCASGPRAVTEPAFPGLVPGLRGSGGPWSTRTWRPLTPAAGRAHGGLYDPRDGSWPPRTRPSAFLPEGHTTWVRDLRPPPPPDAVGETFIHPSRAPRIAAAAPCFASRPTTHASSSARARSAARSVQQGSLG